MENILILLVGGNPLPNYVVMDYLLGGERNDSEVLPKPNRIILVHSTDTSYLADVLKAKIKLDNTEKLDIEEAERDGMCIMKKISDKLNFHKNNLGIASLHLNYTGGTKPMAVFGCMAVDEFCRDNNINNKILSDLDPDKFIIKVAHNRNGHSYPDIGNLLGKVNLSVKDIFELHNMKIEKEGSDSLTFSDDLLNFNDFVKEAVPKFDVNNLRTEWFDKVRNEIRGKWNKLKEFNFSSYEENNKKYESITSEFPSLINFFENDKFKESLGKKIGENFLEFFTGKWLEDYVLLTLKNLKEKNEISICDLQKGVEASNKGVRTEIDVIAMKGYQMFLFTCTTSQKIGLVKEKAFEGLYRAEQLGGEHAKVISVSLMSNRHTCEKDKDSNIETLKKDLSEFRASKKCHCIGFDEISGEINGKQTLSKKFKEIIEC